MPTVIAAVALLPELPDKQVSVPDGAELDPPDLAFDGQMATLPTEETTPALV
jgi:hypothetical protein